MDTMMENFEKTNRSRNHIPGLTNAETQSFQIASFNIDKEVHGITEEITLSTWQKHIDNLQSTIEADTKKLNESKSASLEESLDKSYSKLPTLVKSLFYRVNKNFFPVTAERIQSNKDTEKLSEAQLEEQKEKVEEQTRLCKEYTTLTVPTAQSKIVFSEMRAQSKKEIDETILKERGKEIEFIRNCQEKIEEDTKLRGSNRMEWREKELPYFNEINLERYGSSGPKTTDYIFPEQKSVRGNLLNDEKGLPKTIKFDDAEWHVLQSKDKSYLVPAFESSKLFGKDELDFSFIGNTTLVNLAYTQMSKADFENDEGAKPAYYELENPSKDIIIGSAMEVETKKRNTILSHSQEKRLSLNSGRTR